MPSLSNTSSEPRDLPPLQVGIDLDGVCYDFQASLREHLRRTGADVSGCTPAERWEFYLDWGLTLDEFLQSCHAGVDEGVVFRHGDPFPGSVEAITRLRGAGCSIHVVTDRSFGHPGASEAATRAWLAEHEIVFDTLHFSADKVGAHPGVEFFIEDRLENYDTLDAAGIQAYLLNRAWNQVPGDARRRVDSIDEFVEIVLASRSRTLAATTST